MSLNKGEILDKILDFWPVAIVIGIIRFFVKTFEWIFAVHEYNKDAKARKKIYEAQGPIDPATINPNVETRE